VTITLLEHQQLQIDTEKKLIPQFEAAEAQAGKNVTVKLIEDVLPDDQFQTLLTTQYKAGTAPDITSYITAWVPDYAAAGYLLDLSSRLAAWPDWQQHFYQILRDRTVEADGKSYSAPRGGSVIQLFYRKDLLDKWGISTAQPTSWQDFIDRMTQLKAKNGGKPPFVMPIGSQWGAYFDEGSINVFTGAGAQLYDPTAKKWIVKSAAISTAFGYMETLIKDGLVPTQDLLSPNPWQPTKYVKFPKGDLQVSTQGQWGWIYDWGPTGQAPIPDLFNTLATWQFPAQSGSPFVYAAEDWRWTISAKTQHPDEVFDFLKFMETGTALAMDNTAVGDTSPRDDQANVAPYSNYPYLIAAEKLIPGGKSFVPQVGAGKYGDAMGAAEDNLLTGKATADQAAAEFQAAATKSLGADQVEVAP
jgi:multiple sugar transport system substrate-binding protein